MKALQSPTGAEIQVDGRKLINFAGSAYLGISRDPALISAATDALHRYGVRVHIPPEYGMKTQPHHDVEEETARFFDTPAAIYLPTGYFIGLAVLTGLRSQFDVVLLDETPHYNLRDAAAASGAVVRTFAHHDYDALESQLSRARRDGLRPVIAVDGVCPTYGIIPQIGRYAELARTYEALLFIDESHTFGALGAGGRGVLEELGIPPGNILRGGSLGKAFCAAGAVIAGQTADVTALRAAPCVRGSAWGLVPGAAMAATSLRLVRERPELLARLRANTLRLKSGLRDLGIKIAESPAPLATFVLGSESEMAGVQQALLSDGVYILHAKYVGTRPEGALRCSVFADHSDQHIDRLIEALRRAL